MNSPDIQPETSARPQNSISKILRHGFPHPRTQRRLGSDQSGINELPEITGRACSWDAIDEDGPTDPIVGQ